MSLPTKRSTFSAASASDDSSYSSPPMKKAKNDLHHSPQHPNTADKVVGFHMEEDPTPAAANLSRKKATLPQPTKKFVIKLNKAKPTLPTNFEENTWEKLQSAIRAIFLKKKNFV
jgi:cullin-4